MKNNIFEVEVFFSSQNIEFPIYLRRLLELFLLLLSLSFHAPSLEDLGVLMIFEEKSLLQKLVLKWLQYTGGGRIFQNGVMHANMAKS
jgi:hypothetical protein